MSRKTVIMRRKIKQQGGNVGNRALLTPSARVKGSGRMQVNQITEGVNDDGDVVRTVKRVPGIDTGKVCTEPMGNKKRDIINRLK